MSERKDTTVIIYNEYADHHDVPLEEWLHLLTTQRDLIPEEYRASAFVEIEIDDDYGATTASLIIGYYRPETDEELKEREHREWFAKQTNEARERAELERLQEKYSR